MAKDGITGLMDSVNRIHRENARCRTCSRDKRIKGRVSPNTTVDRVCPECGEPMNWRRLGPSGILENWEWSMHSRKAILIKENSYKKSRGGNINIFKIE